MIVSVEYTYTDSQRWVTAFVANVIADLPPTKWEMVDLENDTDLARQVNRWITDGNTPSPCTTERVVPQTGKVI